jgi:hypothetical protein
VTKNQWDWSERKHRANEMRRLAYALKNAGAAAARQAARETAVSSEDLARERRRRQRTSARELVRSAKRAPCCDCGCCHPPEVMDFDHRDEAQKSFNLSDADRKSRSLILQELAKCDLLCANCHRIRSMRRRLGLPATLPPPDYEI